MAVKKTSPREVPKKVVNGISDVMEKALEDSLNALGVVTKDDLAALEKRIAKLEAEAKKPAKKKAPARKRKR